MGLSGHCSLYALSISSPNVLDMYHWVFSYTAYINCILCNSMLGLCEWSQTEPCQVGVGEWGLIQTGNVSLSFEITSLPHNGDEWTEAAILLLQSGLYHLPQLSLIRSLLKTGRPPGGKKFSGKALGKRSIKKNIRDEGCQGRIGGMRYKSCYEKERTTIKLRNDGIIKESWRPLWKVHQWGGFITSGDWRMKKNPVTLQRKIHPQQQLGF